MKTLYLLTLQFCTFTVFSQSTYVVDSTSNTSGTLSIYSAISQASAGDTIAFSSQLKCDTITLYNGELNIDKNLIFKGNGFLETIISGNNSSRIFLVNSGVSLALFDMKLIDGYANGGNYIERSGGAILNQGTLISNRVMFAGNEAVSVGGAIYTNASASFKNCVLSGNKSSSDGGGIHNADDASCTIINCTITGNEGSSGGGIFNGFSSIMNLGNSVVALNSLNAGGFNDIEDLNGINYIGSNHIYTSGFGVPSSGNGVDPLFIENVSTAPSTTGNLEPQVASPLLNQISDTTGLALGSKDIAELNRLKSGNLDIGAFEVQREGAIWEVTVSTDCELGSLRYIFERYLENDTILFSSALNNVLIPIDSGEFLIEKDLSIIGNGVHLTKLDAGKLSRLFSLEPGKELAIQKLTLQNGKVDGNGGAILNTNGVLRLEDIHMLNDSAALGGGIYSTGTIDLNRVKIAGNWRNGIYMSGGTSTLTNCQVTGNTNTGYLQLNGNSTISNSTIASNDGYGLYLQDGNLNLANSIVASNQSFDIYKASTASIIDNGTNHINNPNGSHGITSGNNIAPYFSNEINTFPDHGGDFSLLACSFAVDKGSEDTTGLNLGDVDLASNSRINNGRIDLGAFEFDGSHISNKYLVTSTADDGCGSLRQIITGSDLLDTLKFDPILNGNQIVLTSGNIEAYKPFVLQGNGITNTIISGDSTQNIFFLSSDFDGVINDLELREANANTGGAIYNNGALELNRVRLVNNTAFTGGGLYNTGTCEINYSLIELNSANQGSGINNKGTLTILNSKLRGNSADIIGAGLSNDGTAEIKNSLFSGNSAIDGSAIIAADPASNTRIINCTIAKNAGRAAYLRGTNFIANTVLAKNGADNQPGDLHFFNATFTDGGNNYVTDTSSNHPIRRGNLGDPLFVNDTITAPSIAGDFSLRECSALVNAGSIDTTGLGLPIDDIEQQSRISDSRIDIGAFEFQGAPLILSGIISDYADSYDCGCIRTNILAAALGDTINFDPALNGDTLKLSLGQLEIDKRMVIMGNDTSATILSGQNTHRILHAKSGDTLTISNLSIVNGYSQNNDGGAVVNDSILVLKNIKVAHSVAENGGGILNNTNATLHLIDSRINQNSVNDNRGGGLVNSGTSYIQESLIELNVASEGSGIMNTGSIQIQNSKLRGNSASIQGAGLSNDGTAEIKNSLFSGNSAIDGSAIMAADPASNTRIINCTIAKNGGRAAYLGGTNFIANTVLAKNGADNQPGDLHFFNATFTDGGNNYVTDTNSTHPIRRGNFGDPLFVNDTITAPSIAGDFSLRECSALVNAGSIDTTGLSLPLGDIEEQSRISDSRIDIGAFEYQGAPFPMRGSVNNYTDGYYCGCLRTYIQAAAIGDTVKFDPVHDGDTLKLSLGQLEIGKRMVIMGNDTSATIISGQNTHRIIHAKSGDTLTISNLSIVNGYSQNNDGGAVVNDSMLVLKKVKVAHSMAENGGAILNNTNATLHLIDSRINHNANNSSRGGGIYNLGILKALNSKLDHNILNYYGGSLMHQGTYFYGNGLTITNNKFESSTIPSFGSGIYNLGSNFTLKNSIISGNESSSGAGFYNNTVATIDSCWFINNSSNSGGAISNDDSLFLNDSYFKNNFAKSGIGGAINNKLAGNLYISNTTLDSNRTVLNGGAISNHGNLFTRLNTFTQNTAELYGGSVMNYGEMDDSASVFSTSKSEKGGGALLLQGNAKFKSSIFEQNHSESNGGAILQENSNSLFTKCQFLRNEAGGFGGAIQVDQNASVEIIHSRIKGNGAQYSGGAINISNSITGFSLRSSVVSGNVTEGLYAGGILISSGANNVVIFNSTISGNKANLINGRGVGLCSFSGFTLKNTVISQNYDEQGEDDFYFSSTTPLIQENNHITTSNLTTLGGLGINPLFTQNVATAPSLAGNLTPLPSSPLINSGTSDTTGLNLSPVDIAGKPRVYGSAIDIGAFEFQCPKASSEVLNITSAITAGPQYHRATKITANSSITASDLIGLRGYKDVVLLPGFEAESSSVFEASIEENCFE